MVVRKIKTTRVKRRAPCKKGQVRRVKTGRCVKKCLKGQVRSAATGRCVKKCLKGQVRSAATGRCIKRNVNSVAYKKHLAALRRRRTMKRRKNIQKGGGKGRGKGAGKGRGKGRGTSTTRKRRTRLSKSGTSTRTFTFSALPGPLPTPKTTRAQPKRGRRRRGERKIAPVEDDYIIYGSPAAEFGSSMSRRQRDKLADIACEAAFTDHDISRNKKCGLEIYMLGKDHKDYAKLMRCCKKEYGGREIKSIVVEGPDSKNAKVRVFGYEEAPTASGWDCLGRCQFKKNILGFTGTGCKITADGKWDWVDNVKKCKGKYAYK